MSKPIGYVLDFSAAHPCWSSETGVFDSQELRVDLLSSIFEHETRSLYTSIRIIGVESAIRKFRKGLRQAPNTQLIHTFLMPSSQGRRKSAFCNFNVKADGTITQSVASYFPTHFSVKMEEGLENWSLTFLNQNEKSRDDVIREIESSFSMERIRTYDIMYEDLLEKDFFKNFDSLDWSILKTLIHGGYYDEDRTIDFRDVAEYLGVSFSTVSRRARKLEREALLALMRKESFS